LEYKFWIKKSFIDSSFIEKKVPVKYGIQKYGETVIVPSGWIYWTVYCGPGLSFSAYWNILRIENILSSRQTIELNRLLCLFEPISFSSLIVSACYQKLDELDSCELKTERQSLSFALLKLLPILKAQVLEEILGERIMVSSLTSMCYSSVVYKLLYHSKFGPSMLNELSQIRKMPLPQLISDDRLAQLQKEIDEKQNSIPKKKPSLSTQFQEISTNNIILEGTPPPSPNEILVNEIILQDNLDEEISTTCCQCKYVLFNSKRSCQTCKGYDLCEYCFQNFGITGHQHSMKLFRKIDILSLIDLVDSVQNAVQEYDDVLSYSNTYYFAESKKRVGRHQQKKKIHST